MVHGIPLLGHIVACQITSFVGLCLELLSVEANLKVCRLVRMLKTLSKTSHVDVANSRFDNMKYVLRTQ